MSEEMIIDGVNVSECSYYNKDNEPYCCEVWDNECEAQNCYYKQLQRAKAENGKLKTFIIWLTKQQYYILPPKLKEKCKELLLIEGENE